MALNHLLFLSTLSLRRATLRVLDGSKSSIISIHALLAESDCSAGSGFCRPRYFYPRSPCGERHLTERLHWQVGHFYPRSPCGERHARRALGFVDPDISIHALLAESDVLIRYRISARYTISIHALLAESDHGKKEINPANQTFLSTLSLRRATERGNQH